MWIRFLLRRTGDLLIAGTVVVWALWIASGWYQLSMYSKGGMALMSGGTLTIDDKVLAIDWRRVGKELTLSAQLIPDERPHWTLWRWFRTQHGPFYLRVGVAPLGVGMPIAGLGLRWLGYVGMRRRCRECGYDLRGIRSWVCPECGTVVSRGKKAVESMGEAAIQKRALRTRLSGAMAGMTPEQRAARSAAACGRALAGDLFPAGSLVMLYAPMVERGELDVRLLAEGLWARGCRVCVPRVEWKQKRMVAVEVENLTTDLVEEAGVPGPGMRTPRAEARVVDPTSLDVIVVPGLGFDRAGNRLGRGGGYYDRFLGAIGGTGQGQPAGKPARVAIVFDEQVVESVPSEPHDQRVGWLVTPTEVVRAA
jgi:5-formyltetrahydrofolate cyclo-ligase